ncbi:MAG: hypothetical protein QOH84_3144 [Kribbellaceae bacterium]|jgi:hypothetical protein|nr:hypothetical protein [Kribbellaceae bacterium]
MKPYTEIPGFENVYLEESYVLGVEAQPGVVRFELEVVLTPQHPEYTAPPPGTFECYVRGTLEFGGVTELEWVEQGSPAATDASGEVDYGHIDSMSWDGRAFELDGDWGSMRISADTAMITLTGKALS